MDSNRNETLKKIFHQMKTDRQQRYVVTCKNCKHNYFDLYVYMYIMYLKTLNSLSCWRHTQLLTRWTKDGVTKETVDHKKRYGYILNQYVYSCIILVLILLRSDSHKIHYYRALQSHHQIMIVKKRKFGKLVGLCTLYAIYLIY